MTKTKILLLAVGIVFIIVAPGVIAWFILGQESEIKAPEIKNESSKSGNKLFYFASIYDTETRLLGKAHEVWKNGNYLYITSIGDNGLEILDVSDPANPELVVILP